MRITIGNEEVLSNKDFTIKEQMLNTPSVILNNVYPKNWEDDKDYVSRFYYPDDYSKCKIYDNSNSLAFCGVVKNSGDISLNPREPHYCSLQILDFKTFLSEGENLDFVITNKTVIEAISQVVSAIREYGFVVGNINILNPDEKIGAYSTKDKTPYDVFNYIADITQSRWTTHMIDENIVAIDFYDPTLMPEGETIEYTKDWFIENLIDDMFFSYGTNDYRNKQIMTSDKVYANITQSETKVSSGYQTQYSTEQSIGKIEKILVDGIQKSFATSEDKSIGITADFYYTVGNNYFKSDERLATGQILTIVYIPIIKGRQIVTNQNEIERVSNSTDRKGTITRYENRNDATTSTELQLIGQSYIKYKGVPEIKLTVVTRKNIWDIGQRVNFNAPIEQLTTDYMVKTKSINYISTVKTIFYTYELTSSFNSEQAINYFDNQRYKANGNIGDGEYISRDIDIENTANIIFYDTTVTEIEVSGSNMLENTLDIPLNN